MHQVEGQVIDGNGTLTISGCTIDPPLEDGDYKVVDGELYKKVNQPYQAPPALPWQNPWAPYDPPDVWIGGPSRDLPYVTWTTGGSDAVEGVSAY